MKHILFDYARKIDRTHPGLGNMATAAFLAVKARKAFILSAVSGTGKTTGLQWAANQIPSGYVRLDSITRSGLVSLESELNDYHGCLVVSDLGAVDTLYSVRESCKVIALLCHEHGLSKKNVAMDLNIDGYYGSALSTVQPASMSKLVGGAEWESVLADKTVRYYHLNRPVKISHMPLNVETKWGLELDDITIPAAIRQKIFKWVESTVQPWSDARAAQHWLDFTRAAAALSGQGTARNVDLEAARTIMRPVRLEAYLIGRESISAQRHYLADDHCILTELATYGRLSHSRTIKNYRISKRTLQRSITAAATWLIPAAKGAAMHLPSEQALDVLAECGYEGGQI